ncbi:LppU/SCO3897 family protein [Streptomyces syringium]|uniref:LppU/SCO3897 family protein n=1 Tax=Streptomyces syringium TaxID=76729 RepID=UPI0033F900D2
MPAEITLRLTPKEASLGTTRDVDLPSGTVRIRIPPVRDRNLIRIATPQGEVLVRVEVSAGRGPWVARLVALAAVAAVIGLIVALNGGDDSSSPTTAPVPTVSSSPYSDPTTTAPAAPTAPDTSLPLPGSLPPAAPTPTASPFESGTCLDGTIPASTTPVKVDVDVVPCSSSNAHYRVIRTFPGTTEMSKCESVPSTQYAYSSRSTWGGRTMWEVVYCLVGLGSYARG